VKGFDGATFKQFYNKSWLENKLGKIGGGGCQPISFGRGGYEKGNEKKGEKLKEKIMWKENRRTEV
jgi:hypothetical protein